MIRVLLVDDHQPVRAGLQSLLATVDDIQVVGEATDGDEAIGVASDTDPQDVVRGVRVAANASRRSAARSRTR